MLARTAPAQLEVLANDFDDGAKVRRLAVQPPFLYQT
jgi:hypothetical protein